MTMVAVIKICRDRFLDYLRATRSCCVLTS